MSLSNNARADHKLGEGKGIVHSCWRMVPKCYSQAVPSYTHQESGKMGACHSHSCTNLEDVFGYPQRSLAYMHHESANRSIHK